MEISHSNKFLFVHIPKTAGTSVSEVLRPYSNTLKPNPLRTAAHALRLRTSPDRSWFEQHDSVRVILERWGKEVLSEYFSFAFVRNPYEHAMSHYFYTKNYKFGLFNNLSLRGLTFIEYLEWRLQGHDHQRMQRRTRFACMPDQSFYVIDKNENISVDKIFYSDNVNDALNVICATTKIPVPAEVPNLRISKNKKRDVLNKEAISLIRRLYERDFVNFEFDYDPSIFLEN